MNDLEREVLQIIGEDTTTPDVFTDDSAGIAPIRDSLNDAIEEISMLTGSVSGTYAMLLRSGQIFYRVDSRRDRFAWVTDALLATPKRRLDQTDIVAMNAENPGWMTNNGTPFRYGIIENDVLFFWPTPASPLVCDLSCIVIPARYTNDYDRIKVREMFKHTAVQYAVGEYYASRGDAKTAKEYHDRYLERLGIIGLYPTSPENVIYYRTEKNQAVAS